MSRNLFIFLGTFLAGALIALVARAALFKPHADHSGHPVGGGDYAPMVSNALVPAPAKSAQPPPASTAPARPAPKATSPAKAADPHANHNATPRKTAASKPVNTICSICGMDVDPNLPTAEYQGQTIGFGCRMCPPKFKADPDRYGPSYIRNELIKR